MSKTLDVKKISKGLAEDIKKLTLESNVSKIIEDFEVKAEKLNKEVNNLEVKRVNLANDVQSLMDTKKELDEKNSKLSKYLADKVEQATSEATKRVANLESELTSEKKRVIEERTKLGGEKQKYTDMQKECVLLKEKLSKGIKDNEAVIKDADILRKKLENVIGTIKGAL